MAVPSVDDFRFMAWVAISHGASGLLWFGSGFEKGPSPLLENLIEAVGELNALQPYLVSSDISRVRAITDERHCPLCWVARLPSGGTAAAQFWPW